MDLDILQGIQEDSKLAVQLLGTKSKHLQSKDISMTITCITKTFCPHIYMKDGKLMTTELRFLNADSAVCQELLKVATSAHNMQA